MAPIGDETQPSKLISEKILSEEAHTRGLSCSEALVTRELHKASDPRAEPNNHNIIVEATSAGKNNSHLRLLVLGAQTWALGAVWKTFELGQSLVVKTTGSFCYKLT